jgi:DNA-binding SARP family transcriptional activator
MQIRLLGPMQVWQTGEPVALGGPQQRAVLAILALNANRAVPPAAFLEGLWGERGPSGAINAVQVNIYRIRKALDRASADADGVQVQRRGPGYVLHLAGDRIDVNRFEELATRASRQVATAPHAAAAAFREALDLWRGPALAEFAGMPFADPEIARLQNLQLAVVVGRIDADLALGRHDDLLAELELLTAQHPLDQRLHRQLILALYRADRQADALETYRRLRERLSTELRRAPDPSLRALERAVLAHDRRLDWHAVEANVDARAKIPTQPGRTDSVSTRSAPAGADPDSAVVADQAEPTARRRPDVWNVPARNPHFTGRDRVLRAVADRLGRGENTLVVQALYGLGGVGKSQLAIEFAHRYADRFTLVWWVDAQRAMLIGDQLARLAPRLGLSATTSAQERMREVMVELSARSEWLLIFDNAERAADVAAYRPSGAGHILVTSRTPGWGALGGRIPVDVLDRADTIDLFRSRLPAIDEVVAADLAAELGDLPLAVAQAVAHIEQSGMDPADYLRQFSTRRSAYLARGEVLGYQGRVDTAWDISLGRLRTNHPAALNLLTYSAFLGPDVIPQELFAHRLPLPDGGGPADPFQLTDAIGAAAALSLLRRTPSGFQLHRLVQEVIRSHLEPDERTRVRDEVVDLLAAAHPGDPADPATWPGYAALVPHVFALGAAGDPHPGVRRLVIDTLSYFNTITNTGTVRSVATEIHDRWRRVLGPDHPDTLTLGAYLTLTLMWDGAARPAGELAADSLARAVRTRGPDDRLTLRLASYLSCARAWLADSDGARSLAWETLGRLDQAWAPDDPDRLRLTAYPALALVWTGDPAAAEVAGRAHDRARAVLGADHPTTLMAAADVCLGLLTSPDADRTRRVALDTLTRARPVLGEHHLITLAAASALTMATLWCGDRDGADRVATELLAGADRFLEPDHVVALMAAAALTAVRADPPGATPAGPAAADLPGAVDLRRAVDRARRLLGADHPITLITAVAVARLLMAGSAPGSATDRSAQAGLIAETRGRVTSVFGTGHPLLAALPPLPPS